MAIAGVSSTSRRSAREHRCESKSSAATRRSLPSKRRCSRAIPTSRGCAWRYRIGRPSFGSFKEAGASMRQTLHKRLRQLEEASARVRTQSERPDEEATRKTVREKVLLFLRLRGIEKQDHESLMEAWARALEISCRELSTLLRG